MPQPFEPFQPPQPVEPALEPLAPEPEIEPVPVQSVRVHKARRTAKTHRTPKLPLAALDGKVHEAPAPDMQNVTYKASKDTEASKTPQSTSAHADPLPFKTTMPPQ